jgi:hypothetical protein
MRRTVSLSVAMSLSLLALPAVGQDEGANVAAIYCSEVQPGQQARFEEGVKKHVDWHRKQNDTWTWNAWSVETGPDTGNYCAGTFGHKWEDFDKPAVSEEADMADYSATVLPFVKKTEGSFWVALPKVSRPAAEPTPMSSVVFFHVRYGMNDEFDYLIGEFTKAIEQTKMPWHYTWVRLANGGEGGTYALVQPRANFASFNPSGKPFDEMLAEAYGKAGADSLLARWTKAVKGTESQLTKGRPDLSYVPKP